MISTKVASKCMGRLSSTSSRRYLSTNSKIFKNVVDDNQTPYTSSEFFKTSKINPNSPIFTSDQAKKDLIDSMIRVNHAGELGAQVIYQGQLAVFKGTAIEPTIKEMSEQEKKHLQFFETLLNERRVRPTVLNPIWSAFGFAVGAGSALLGKETAMALTVAVEEVITEHYNSQLSTLNDFEFSQTPEDQKLKDMITESRDDEMEHMHTGLAHDAEKSPFYNLFTSAVKAGTRSAIWLSTRI